MKNLCANIWGTYIQKAKSSNRKLLWSFLPFLGLLCFRRVYIIWLARFSRFKFSFMPDKGILRGNNKLFNRQIIWGNCQKLCRVDNEGIRWKVLQSWNSGTSFTTCILDCFHARMSTSRNSQSSWCPKQSELLLIIISWRENHSKVFLGCKKTK